MKKLLIIPLLFLFSCVSIESAKSNTLREIDFDREAKITCNKKVTKTFCTVEIKDKIINYQCDADKCWKIK